MKIQEGPTMTADITFEISNLQFNDLDNMHMMCTQDNVLILTHDDFVHWAGGFVILAIATATLLVLLFNIHNDENVIVKIMNYICLDAAISVSC